MKKEREWPSDKKSIHDALLSMEQQNKKENSIMVLRMLWHTFARICSH